MLHCFKDIKPWAALNLEVLMVNKQRRIFSRTALSSSGYQSDCSSLSTSTNRFSHTERCSSLILEELMRTSLILVRAHDRSG